jgi:predicted ribosomally synthesized peptide with nif11-like leader
MTSAKDFLSKVEGSPALQARFDSVNWNTGALTEIAAEEGYVINATEMQTALDELFGDLSEEQLMSVAGTGNGNGRPNPGGPVDPGENGPPPSQPGFWDGSGWSPPPGDVSGNSCFFSGRY